MLCGLLWHYHEEYCPLNLPWCDRLIICPCSRLKCQGNDLFLIYKVTYIILVGQSVSPSKHLFYCICTAFHLFCSFSEKLYFMMKLRIHKREPIPTSMALNYCSKGIDWIFSDPLWHQYVTKERAHSCHCRFLVDEMSW